MSRIQKTFLGVVIAIMAAFPLASRWMETVDRPLATEDEAAWIFYTHYYNLAFDQKDVWNDDWQDDLAFHHPPLVRFVFGTALAREGLQWRSSDDFRWWQARDLDYATDFREAFWDGMRERVPPLALFWTRTISTLCAVLVIAGIYLLGREINVATGATAALIAAWNPMLRQTASIGEAETLLLFFLVAAAWLTIRLCKMLVDDSTHPRVRDCFTIAWGIVAALAFSTKINGLLAWIFGAACVGWLVWRALDERARRDRLVLLVCATGLLITLTILVNPTLYRHPVGNLARYFTFRLEQMELQREAGFWNVFDSSFTRLAHFIKHLFLQQDVFFTAVKLPLGMLWFCAGLFSLGGGMATAWRELKLTPPLWVLGGLALTGAACWMAFFVPWPRYLVPLLPWVAIVEAAGAIWLVELSLKNQWRPATKPLVASLFLTGFVTMFCASRIFPPPTSYSREEKDFRVLMNTVKRHPHNKTMRAELAIVYRQLADVERHQGNTEKTAEYTQLAEAEWAEIAKPVSNEEFPPFTRERDEFFRRAIAHFPDDPRIRIIAERFWAHYGRSSPEATIEVGFGAREIAPEVGSDKRVWLAGYGMGRRATGIHDPLMARATVLRSGGQKIALISLDLVGFFENDTRRVRDALKDYAAIVIASTHNHEGPDTMGLWGGTPFTSGVDPEYNTLVRASCIAAVRDAEKNMKPSVASLGKVDASDLMNDSRQPVVKMGELTVLHISDSQAPGSKTLGLVVFWHNHPEFLGARNTLVSADFVGAALKKLSEKYGCPVNYFNGAVGGLMSPRHKSGNDFAALDEYANDVLAKIELARSCAQPVRLAPFSTRAADVFIPLQNQLYVAGYLGGILPREVFDEKYRLLDKDAASKFAVEGKTLYIRTSVGLWQLGDARVVLVPGEIYPELVIGGIQTPQDPAADIPGAPVEPPIFDPPGAGQPQLIIGLANDEIGYIIPQSQWDSKPPFAYGRRSAQYGEINSCGPEVAPRIAAALQELKTKTK